MVDVGRSLYPNKAYAGNEVGFAIALRNEGGTSVTLDEGTTFFFTDGSENYGASLTAPVASWRY